MLRGMQPFNLTLAANVPQSVEVQGDWFHVLTAPLSAGIWVRVDEGKQANYFEGVGLRIYYDRVELMSLADQQITVLLGFGEVSDSRATANLEVNSTIEPANLLTDLPEVTVPAGASIKLADADSRKELRVALKSSAADGVYLGSATVANHTGGFLEPGSVDYVALEAELWAYNPGAVDVVVNLLQLERV